MIENIHFVLEKEDYLRYQLFTATHSQNIQKQRWRGRVLVPVFWLILGVWFVYDDGNFTRLILFSVMSVVWFLVYPKYTAWNYKRHFAKHIDEHYANRIGTENVLDFTKEGIFVSSQIGDSTFKYEAIEALQKLPKYYFIKLITGISIIIPRDAIDDKKSFEEYLSEHRALSWENHKDWVWK